MRVKLLLLLIPLLIIGFLATPEASRADQCELDASQRGVLDGESGKETILRKYGQNRSVFAARIANVWRIKDSKSRIYKLDVTGVYKGPVYQTIYLTVESFPLGVLWDSPHGEVLVFTDLSRGLIRRCTVASYSRLVYANALDELFPDGPLVPSADAPKMPFPAETITLLVTATPAPLLDPSPAPAPVSSGCGAGASDFSSVASMLGIVTLALRRRRC